MEASWWMSLLAIILAFALLIEAVRVLRGRWMLVDVEGPSMEPALSGGDEVLAKRARRAETGQIVVVTAPDPALGWAEPPKPSRFGGRPKGPYWVKRVAAAPGERMPGSEEPVPAGHYFLLSDNPAGEDSRRHGPCPAEALLGVMIRKFEKPRAS